MEFNSRFPAGSFFAEYYDTIDRPLASWLWDGGRIIGKRVEESSSIIVSNANGGGFLVCECQIDIPVSIEIRRAEGVIDFVII
jgi:hypothetical protein